MAVTGAVYVATGVLNLYFLLAPLLGNGPHVRPGWVAAVLLFAAACLFGGAAFQAKPMRFAAAIGSGLLLATFLWGMVLVRLAVRLGYAHVEHELITFRATWIDRLRVTLDRPLLFLFLVFALTSFFLAVRSVAIAGKVARA